MICKKCGTENYENAKFCRECGRPLIIIETKKKQRPISVKVCVDIIIIVVVCGAMLFASFFYQHKDNLYVKISDNSIVEELKPDYIKVAEKYAKAINKGMRELEDEERKQQHEFAEMLKKQMENE